MSMSLADAPELVEYQDEPQQLKSGSPGKNGFARLEFARRGEHTDLVREAHRVPLQVQQALYWDEGFPGMPYVFILSPTGGMLQGDRHALDITLGPGAQAHVTTQSATKIYEMDANYASQLQHIRLSEGAYLEYLPDITIPFKHSRFLSQTCISISATATLLYAEVLMPGRKHMDGELFQYDVFSSWVRAERLNGVELFTEKLVIEPERMPLRAVGVMGPFDVLGTVLLLTSRSRAERVFEEVPAAFTMSEGWAAGASHLPNDAGLLYKILGTESHVVLEQVRKFWALVRRETVGVPLPIARKF
jgi:urease accessory protein